MMQQANGRMIVLGREARELTQSALAQRLGVGQGTLSKIEGGLLTCPPEVLTKISESLGFPEEFFTALEEIHGVGTEAHHCLYRRRAAVPAKTLKRIEAEINIRRMNLSSLLTSTEIRPATTIPSLAIGDYNDDPAEVARALRIYWKMPSGPVDNVVRLIERAGGAILPHDFGVEGVDATSIRIPGLPPLFFYNPNLTGDRLRFTLAHELAHIVMHEVPHPNIENEADQFAAEFLMPAREIGIHLSGLTLPKAAQLKPYWKVSMAAIVYRAKTLGKITDAQYRYLFYQIGAGNIRKREPASLDIPVELPTLQTNLLTFFRKELGYSTAELAKLFRITESEFDRFYSSRSASRHLRAVA
ncbi:ImmA/IrrE family metallo-endopeptidase [Burkholderia ambifaria]|uniref:helix-turn-helix domain-containing protein n=1 Tax=Burkholderia ambifaria TaxID=152480 RepID=UPI001B9FC34B|nr:XRE family transcriptional regulator [Burkholderia ambifaria]MBR8335545.1 ImmA/IrrE family metallo-endopeptidase [Burkholderia ambifaria]